MTSMGARCSISIGALLLVSSCASDGAATGATGQSACQPGAISCATAAAGSGAAVGAPSVPPAQLGTGTNGVGANVGAPATNPAVGGAVAQTSGVPCAVAQVASARCTGCHQSSPKFGAPMPLMSLADFQAPAKSNPARKVYQLIPERIAPTDVAKRMPPTSMPALSDVDQQTLDQWVASGALASTDSCPITVSDIVPTSGTGTAGSPPSAHSGGSSTEPIAYDDPDMKCYKLLAHAQGNKDAPYSQGPGENYVNFDFAAPWTGTVYSRAIKLAIDPNSKVIHHWLLFKQSAPVSDGSVAAGSGTHPDGILLHGWAPGATPLYLDPDVGMKLEDTVGYQLEVHFNNATGAAGDDHSGAEICVTTRVPPHVAELAWVGTDSISGTTAVGNCAPSSNEAIHIIAAQPHMHLKGRHMKVVINHTAGTQDVIHDEDFSFDNQRYYVLSGMMMPGDTMTTTCSYSAPASFGPSTNDEMCYFFSMHWPGGALRSAGIGTVIHGADSCM